MHVGILTSQVEARARRLALYRQAFEEGPVESATLNAIQTNVLGVGEWV